MQRNRTAKVRVAAAAAVATGLLAGDITASTTDVFGGDSRSTDRITNASASKKVGTPCVIDRQARNVKFVRTVKTTPALSL
ncbi:hypothetical protein [Streptomyces sp. NPDC003719]